MADERIEEMSLEDINLSSIHEGEVVKGKVISVKDEEVFVNIGYMSDGVIPKEELSEEERANPKEYFKPEDELNVYIVKVNDGEGNVLLSKIKADAEKVWDELKTAMEKDSVIEVKVKEVVKGGVVAQIKGIRAFIPASQLSLSYVEDLNTFVGKTLKVKVIEFDAEKNKIVLSAKEVAKEERELKRTELFKAVEKGQRRTGTVTNLTKFGAFVDLGGLEGLIPMSELSWKRVKNASEVLSTGDVVEVYVLDADAEKNRISLSLKELIENPWTAAVKKYSVGQVAEATITKLTDFGAFAALEDGVEGLVHVSEISEERISKPSAVLNSGDKVKVKILDIKEKEHRISLSIKQAVESAVMEENSKFISTNKDEPMNTLGDLFKDKLKNFKFEE